MTPKMPITTSRELLRALQRADFYIHHQTGSHVVLKHADGRRVIVPHHSKEMKKGTVSAILRESNLSMEDLIGLLH